MPNKSQATGVGDFIIGPSGSRTERTPVPGPSEFHRQGKLGGLLGNRVYNRVYRV